MGKTAQDNKWTILGVAASAYTGNPYYAQAGMTADTYQKQAKAQEYQMEIAKRQEQMSARDREIQRRRNLLEQISRRNLMAAAGGVDPYSGSYLNLINQDRADMRADTLADRAMTASRINQYSQQARTARETGNVRIGGTMIEAYKQYQDTKD